MNQDQRPAIALSLDYRRLLRGLDQPPDPAQVGASLLMAVAGRYREEHRICGLHEVVQGGATYLFDLASSVGAPQDDRTVAAWTVTPLVIGARDVTYQRGYPLGPGADGAAIDRGHLIPHLSGGEFGPNIFPQDRALNRGWSEQGRRFRALEREAAATPGTLYFGYLIYDDESSYPTSVETGLLRNGELHVDRFNNRPTRP